MEIKKKFFGWWLLAIVASTVCISSACRRDDDDDDKSPPPVGTARCLQCHYNFPSNQYAAGDLTDTGNTGTQTSTFYDDAAKLGIGENYQLSVHYSPSFSPTAEDYVKCEGCHGNGGWHQGVGAIPYPAPGLEECGNCHADHGFDLVAFQATGHANADNLPDRYFFQGGTGTSQAKLDNTPEFKSDRITPVNKNEHIEECSVCHNYSTKPEHIAENELPNPPHVSCAACHDPHRPADRANRNTVRTRTDSRGTTDPSFVLNFKPQQVNNGPAGTQFGAKNLISGTWVRPRMHYPYIDSTPPTVGVQTGHANYALATQDSATDVLRLSPERLCASCHTKGQYLYGAYAGTTPITATHNEDIFTQYLKAGHSQKTASPFSGFSLLSTSSSRKIRYPYDMGVTDGGKSQGLNATVDTNGTLFSCLHCHHGIASIDYQKGVQGGITHGDTDKAHVLWGDSTVICITCHDPHANGSATRDGNNIRVPVYLSYSNEFTPTNSPGNVGNVRGGANKMLDLTEIPAGAGESIICLFCHQGRESGWTVWNRIRREPGGNANGDGNFPYNSPDAIIDNSGFKLETPHYLAGGALLWSKNGWEYIVGGVPKQYSEGIPAHQQKNCAGCHMATAPADNSAGGHTWHPQVSTCQSCHSGVADFSGVIASMDYNGDNVSNQTVHDEIGTISYINYATTPQPAYGTGKGGTGLLGLLNEALYDKGIRYTSGRPPFRIWNTASTEYTAWNTKQLSATLNFYYLEHSTEGTTHIHNPYYAVQLLIDSLEALDKTTNPATGKPFGRPAGTRSATDYRALTPQ